MLDAGFPAMRGSDLEAIQAISDLSLGIRLGATARPVVSDINAAEASRASDVFLFMPTSDHRLSKSLGISREKATDMLFSGAADVVSRNMTLNLVFEDATRSDRRWLASLVEQILRDIPIKRLVLADTVGCSWPAQISRLFSDMKKSIGDNLQLCSHCHNDFGLAVANTLATVAAGATCVTCTVNGIGERAGNADLAETVAAIEHLFGIHHGLDAKVLPTLSETVERISGIYTSPLKPVTGYNVYRHESGIHVDSMIKDKKSYEFLPSEWIGREPEYLLGKHSGRASVRQLLKGSNSSPQIDPVKEDLVELLLHRVHACIDDCNRFDHNRAYAVHNLLTRQLLSGVDIDVLLRELGASNALRDLKAD